MVQCRGSSQDRYEDRAQQRSKHALRGVRRVANMFKLLPSSTDCVDHILDHIL